MADFKLTPCEVPPVNKATVYADVLATFAKGKASACLVEIKGKKPATVHQGLLKAKKSEKSDVKIVRRGDAVYLTKP